MPAPVLGITEKAADMELVGWKFDVKEVVLSLLVEDKSCAEDIVQDSVKWSLVRH